MLMRLYHGRYTEQIEIADAATILMVGLIFDRSSVLDFARYLRVLAVRRMAAPGSIATELRYPQHVRSSPNRRRESRHRRSTSWATSDE
jgi:hypothetical protein